MPAETNQRGRSVDADSVLDLLLSLLGDPDAAAPSSTLAVLDVDDTALTAPWEALCEEYAERSLGLELEPETLPISMTLADAATVMAALLNEGSREAD